MPTTFLFEPNNTPGLDAFLDWLRGSSSGASASRKGGALALSHHVKRGGIAGLLVDRNTRRRLGGIWAPFFGLDACTTPLPAQLARRHGVPIVPLFCLPVGGGRYRIELGPQVDADLHDGPFDEDVLELTRRINVLVEERIRRQPEAWNWTLKRFKSRPTRERGRYPPYSLFDPR
jgi:KDO2-lipid IV(A) lauroyltransferase